MNAKLKTAGAALALALASAGAAGAEPSAGGAGGAGIKAALKAVEAVARDEVGLATRLLHGASASLRERWDPALVREAGRVLNLSMNSYRKGYETVATPFRAQLAGERRGEFLDLLLPALDEANREVFLRFLEIMERVDREGNG